MSSFLVELARALRAAGAPQPAQLIVSARRAPHLADNEPPMHRLDDDALVAEIGRRYGGIPAEVLQHRDLLALLLPGLRADMSVVETHQFIDGPALACPITVLGGAADARANPEQLDAWSRHTAAGHRVRLFPGGHFYFQEAAVRAALLGEIAHVVGSAPAPAPAVMHG